MSGIPRAHEDSRPSRGRAVPADESRLRVSPVSSTSPSANTPAPESPRIEPLAADDLNHCPELVPG